MISVPGFFYNITVMITNTVTLVMVFSPKGILFVSRNGWWLAVMDAVDVETIDCNNSIDVSVPSITNGYSPILISFLLGYV